jgi:hypothetical protein
VRNHATKGGVPVGSQSPTVRVRQSPDILGPSGATLPKEITTLSAGDYSGTLFFFFFVFQVTETDRHDTHTVSLCLSPLL